MEFGRTRRARVRRVPISTVRAVGCRLRDGARRLQSEDSRAPSPGNRAAPASHSNPIDGPPPAQFRQLVQNLNNEAQSRQLAVMSRDSPSAYRVRGYLAAKVAKRRDHDLLGLGRVRPRRSPRLAHHRRGNRQGRQSRRLGRRRRRDAEPDRPQQHGSARRVSDLARGRAQHARYRTATIAMAGTRILAGSGRHLPHFPAQCRSGARATPRSLLGAAPATARAAPLHCRRPAAKRFGTLSARSSLTLPPRRDSRRI